MRRRLFPGNFFLVLLLLVPLQDRAVAQGATMFLTAQTQTFPVGSVSTLAVADLNGDGKPDVVTANNGFVTVLLNQGHGSFRAGGELPGASYVPSNRGL